MNRLLVAAVTCAGVLFAATTSQAALQLQIQDNGTIVAGVKDAGTGQISFSSANADPNFTLLTVSSIGVPVVASPDFATVTFEVTSATGFSGTHTLTILVTQTGLTSPAGSLAFASTFTGTFLLNGQNIASAAAANYVDPDDGAFATTIQLASATFTSGSTTVGPVVSTADVGAGPYSETEVFTVQFTGGGAAFSASAQLILAAPVPEPASLALLGSALLGLGLVRRRR